MATPFKEGSKPVRFPALRSVPRSPPGLGCTVQLTERESSFGKKAQRTPIVATCVPEFLQLPADCPLLWALTAAAEPRPRGPHASPCGRDFPGTARRDGSCGQPMAQVSQRHSRYVHGAAERTDLASSAARGAVRWQGQAGKLRLGHRAKALAWGGSGSANSGPLPWAELAGGSAQRAQPVGTPGRWAPEPGARRSLGPRGALRRVS
ncbi:hypothetical protein VULLAG_LOCUS9888 [Vulpes lagopus]|uniref:uncharacterized protein LOC121481306 n=1 Tax=Vulpes lagopus TaxID=494514 RepID=UPI001BC9C288|nr:uncharacterized protein LOC121481306 [Vulpes lagopus]